jgi:hypothetical protein
MSWSLEIKITNNTKYKIDVVNNSLGLLGTVKPGAVWISDSLTDPNNANALRFWQTDNIWYMQGGISAGPEAGVYVDKGWESPTTITAAWDANGQLWTQSGNGGLEILPWDGFTEGGLVSVTFDESAAAK